MLNSISNRLMVRTSLLCLLYSGFCISADLNDGIPPDTPIDDSLKTNINESFINSKAKGLLMMGSDKVISEEDGVVGQGNIVIKPGVDLPPGVIIINNSDVNGATAVSK
ncbi:MAG TPA: hypothetical protein ENJ86_03585 [Methylothermaceae bacterium]|nr:hypothetical protein [Methylothermaceae bacterium]